MTVLKFILLVCVCTPALGDTDWNGLVVKWAPLGYASKLLNAAFYDIPTSKDKAVSAGWTQAESDSDLWTVWCLPNDGRVCVLLDQQGTVAGMEVGLPPADYANPPYDPADHPLFSTRTRFNQTITGGRFFLVSQDVLKSGGRANTDDGIGTGLWVQEGDSFTEIPTAETRIKSETKFTEENCVPAMGKHYYYNTTPALDCKDFEPYFLLTNVKTGNVHGLGFQSIGMPSHKDRTWFESVPAIAIRPTVPTTPDCLVDWAEKYGVISLHVYFVSKPWNIGCGGLFGLGK